VGAIQSNEKLQVLLRALGGVQKKGGREKSFRFNQSLMSLSSKTPTEGKGGKGSEQARKVGREISREREGLFQKRRRALRCKLEETGA